MSSATASAIIPDTCPGYVDVAVDLAKNVFQVAYLDPSTHRFINRQLTRAKFSAFISDPDGFRKRIAVEACGASHYWCREAIRHGHKAIMIPASATRTFVQANKSDANDAKAIWQLMHCPNIQTVRIRSEDNQMLGCLLKYREKLVSEKTKITNWIRSQLYELGEIATHGCGKVLPLADEVTDEARNGGKRWSDIIAMLNASWHKVLEGLDEDIGTIDKFITERAEASDLDSRLMTIPFIGSVSATVIEYVMEDPSYYENGRQFSSYSGFAPRHTGTGGKVAVMGVGAQGSHVLKRVLFQAAMALYMCARTLPTPKTGEERNRRYLSPWVVQLGMRKPVKKTVCAIANRLCRIAWAVASKKDGRFEDGRTTLIRRMRVDAAGMRNSLESPEDCEFDA